MQCLFLCSFSTVVTLFNIASAAVQHHQRKYNGLAKWSHCIHHYFLFIPFNLNVSGGLSILIL